MPEAAAPDPSAVVIRSARPADMSDLSELLWQLDQQHARLQPQFFREQAPKRPVSELQALVHDPRHEVFVACRSEQVVGVLVLQWYDAPGRPLFVPMRRARIEELVVADTWRRRGIGRQLVQEAQAWCRRHDIEQLVLTVWSGNDEAEPFYGRMGWREVSRVLVLDI